MSGPTNDDPRIGTELARYRIEALLGRGGMGVVYLAEDLRLGRKVALKLLAPELAADERFRERFLRESRLAASLDHSHIVPIYEAGEAEGVLYIAMRHVESTDLRTIIDADAPLEPTRALELVGQVAEALDAAHAHGLVHRDVKPANVLIALEGGREHCYLADFGLTKRVSQEEARVGSAVGVSEEPLSSERLSQSGQVFGTPDYVAPEQIRGDQIDGRADLYSLGCVLVECLTGEVPFPADRLLKSIFAHLEGEPPSLHARRPELPEAIDAVIARALAKDPDERLGTCRELVESAREALGIGRPVPWWRTPLVLALVGTLLVAASLLAFFLVRGDSAPPAPVSGDTLVRIDPATNEVAATIPVGKNPSAVAVGASGVWVANRDDGTVSHIDPKTNEVDLEVPAHGATADIAVEPKKAQFDSETPIVGNGPSGASIALLDGASGATEDVIQLSTESSFNGVARVAAGPLGVWVATADGRIGRLNRATRTLASPLQIARPKDERSDSYFSGIAVGDDAVWVVGDPADPTVWRVDPTTGELVATIPLPFPPKDVAVGAGAVWVTSQLTDTVSRIDPATEEITSTIPVGRGAAGVAVGAGSVWVANAVDGTVSRIDPHSLRVQTIDVEGSPDDIAIGPQAIWVTARRRPARAGAREEDVVKIGVFPQCEGDFGNLYDSSLAGAELALIQRGGELAGRRPIDGVEGASVAGKRVELYFGCTDGTAEKALSEARRLVESVGVDVLIGPNWPTEAFAIRDYARRHPAVTFVNGIAASQALTLTHPAPNFFSFYTDGAQYVAGVGGYAYKELGWRRAVTVGGTQGFIYTQTAGFVAEFCALGGTIAKQIWVPQGAQDLSAYIAEVPGEGVDGFFMAGPVGTILPLVAEVPELQGALGNRIVGGLFVSFGNLVDVLGDRLDGVVFADKPGLGDSRPEWTAYLSDFQRAFPDLAAFGGFPTAVHYYNSVAGVLQALEAVDGDLSDGQRRFRAALAQVELDSPDGRIRLDERRQAIGPSHLIRYEKNEKGEIVWAPLKSIEDVEQTFGGYFRPGDPPPGQGTIVCKHGNPPPWTSAGGTE